MSRRLTIVFLLIASICPPVCAAVTEVAVARGHHLYGVRQQLYADHAGQRRVAQGHTVSGTTIEAPTEPDKARLEAKNLTTVDSEGYCTFDLYAHANASEGVYKVRFDDHGTRKAPGGSRPLPRTLTVQVYDVVVVTVSFLEGSGTPGALPIRITKDPSDKVVSAPEWWNGVKNEPAAYIRNTGAKNIKVKLFGPPNYSCTVSATGSWGGVSSKVVTFSGMGVYVDSSFQMGSAVPTTVRRDDLGWQWKVTKDGQTRDINVSTHRIYTVYADNSNCEYRSETLYKFGCDWASGETTENNVYSALWGQLSSLGAIGYKYYGTSQGPWADSTRDLILKGDGDCVGWSAFAQDLWGVQGIHVNRAKLWPSSPWVGLRVYTAHQGQGPVTPKQSEFNFHALHRYNNLYHDSSYGGSAYSRLVDWEDHSVKDYLLGGKWHPDTKGTEEVWVEVW